MIERGRLVVDRAPGPWIECALAALPLREAALTRAVASEARKVELSHQDPADRFIAATAALEGMTLLTADQALLSSPLKHVLDATV